MSTPKLSLVTLSVEVAKAHVLVLAVSIELPRFCQFVWKNFIWRHNVDIVDT